MRAPRSVAALAVMVAVSIVALGACGGDDSTGEGDELATVTPTTPAMSPPTPPATTAAPATTAPPATTGSGTAEACRLADLLVTLGTTEGAAGSQYTPIVFTNAGTGPCTLDGHPGVSFVDAMGVQVGASAERTGDATPTVTLAVGERAHATLDYHDPGVFGDCAPAPTAAVKIYPPDETEAITIPFPSSLCTTETPEPELTIGAVSPGVAD